MEYRKDVSNFCYSYAVNQFEKHFPQNVGLSEQQQQLLQHLKVVNDVYKPHRIFKRKDAVAIKDINSKVQITLLEYGHKGTSRHQEGEENIKSSIDLNFEGVS